MRVELFDGEGNKYTVAFEGQISREKALRLLDLVELLGGMPGETGTSPSNLAAAHNELPKFDKARILINRSFPLVWFSSKEVQSAYEKEFKDPITLSTVATYLARMVGQGFLTRMGSSNRLKYKVAPGLPQHALKQQVP